MAEESAYATFGTSVGLVVAGLMVANPIGAAALATAGIATAVWGLGDDFGDSNADRRRDDLIRVLREHAGLGIFGAEKIQLLNEPSYASTISSAQLYVHYYGGVGWLDRMSLNSYWHPNTSFRPHGACAVWVHDDTVSNGFKTKTLTP